MRKPVISLFSVLALASIITGCGGVEGSSVSSEIQSDASSTTSENRIVNGKIASVDVNEYGLSPELGTPPINPGF